MEENATVSVFDLKDIGIDISKDTWEDGVMPVKGIATTANTEKGFVIRFYLLLEDGTIKSIESCKN